MFLYQTVQENKKSNQINERSSGWEKLQLNCNLLNARCAGWPRQETSTGWAAERKGSVKAVLLLFDSLNRHCLSPYGCGWTDTPNFQRLAAHSVQFGRCYAGSLPCMPARRELHTGRYNFLHRSWGPLEPFDDSMPELLKQGGVYTHLISDPQHYGEDGGATYHTRYNSWECVRGQEGDPWKARACPPELLPHFGQASAQDLVNRMYFGAGKEQPLDTVFRLSREFLRDNHAADRWLLHIEPFDPHEPFFTAPQEGLCSPDDYDGLPFDWPPYSRVSEPPEAAAHARKQYGRLLERCDRCLGQLLDDFDRYGLWEDTMLIVTTDHGFLLGEHGWWAKNRPPFYEEIAHLPLFLWDPRSRRAGETRDALVQTVDLAPTLLGFFGFPAPPDMQGHDLGPVLERGGAVREAALFGMHGAHICVTDGRYVLMRADRPDVPLCDYTLLPLRQRARCSPDELQALALTGPFRFTKGCKVLEIPIARGFYPCMSTAEGENRDLLFDLSTDPAQEHPLSDPEQERRLLALMRRLMEENDAPAWQYVRAGLTEEGLS